MPMATRRLNTWTMFVALILLAGLVHRVGAQEPEGENLVGDHPGTYQINREANLYSRPSADSRILTTLRPRTVVEVVRVTEQWYEIRSTRGKENGFVRRSYATPFAGRQGGRQFRKGIFRLTDPVIVRAEPDIDSRKITTIAAGTEVRVVDRTGNWYRVEPESSNRPPGYIPTISAQRVRDPD